MRFFLHLAYAGTNYHGWQKQNGQITVQDVLEKAFETYFRRGIEIVGCGRTDAGVHASCYYAHFDIDKMLDENDLHHLNAILPNDIYLYQFYQVKSDAHARFDAISRSYQYRIKFDKAIFDRQFCYPFYSFHKLDQELLQTTADTIIPFKEFGTFCKSNSGVNSLKCEIANSYWIIDENIATYHITANRFLRGMVRLIVGACLNVGAGKLTIHEIEDALQHQTRLKLDWSVPANGLFLTDVRYPFALGG